MFEYLIAFGAGLISFLSPCVLPLIPGYISYISGQSLQEILKKAKAPKIIDYLSLDVEGAELEVLKNFPFKKYKFLFKNFM